MSIFLVSAEAERDLESATAYYERASVGLAIRFRGDAWRTMEQIAANPGIGRKREAHGRGTEGLRIWRVRGFPAMLIFYRVEGDIVRVARVLHASRDLGPLLEPPRSDRPPAT